MWNDTTVSGTLFILLYSKLMFTLFFSMGESDPRRLSKEMRKHLYSKSFSERTDQRSHLTMIRPSEFRGCLKMPASHKRTDNHHPKTLTMNDHVTAMYTSDFHTEFCRKKYYADAGEDGNCQEGGWGST